MQKKIMALILIIKELEFQKNNLDDCLFGTNIMGVKILT